MRELRKLRTENSKTFRLPNGDLKTVARTRPLHYRSAGGWLDIEPQWVLATDILVLNGTRFKARVATDRVAWQFMSDDGKRMDVTLTHIGVTPVGSLALNVDPVVDGETVTYPDVLPDLDVRVIARVNGLRHRQTLRSAAAPRSFGWLVKRDVGLREDVNDDRTFGMDNLNEVAPTRLLEARRRLVMRSRSKTTERTVSGRVEYRVQSVWSGEVISVDPRTRVKSVTTDPIYPVEVG